MIIICNKKNYHSFIAKFWRTRQLSVNNRVFAHVSPRTQSVSTEPTAELPFLTLPINSLLTQKTHLPLNQSVIINIQRSLEVRKFYTALCQQFIATLSAQIDTKYAYGGGCFPLRYPGRAAWRQSSSCLEKNPSLNPLIYTPSASRQLCLSTPSFSTALSAPFASAFPVFRILFLLDKYVHKAVRYILMTNISTNSCYLTLAGICWTPFVAIKYEAMP